MGDDDNKASDNDDKSDDDEEDEEDNKTNELDMHDDNTIINSKNKFEKVNIEKVNIENGNINGHKDNKKTEEKVSKKDSEFWTRKQRNDTYLDAEKCLEYGIIDYIK